VIMKATNTYTLILIFGIVAIFVANYLAAKPEMNTGSSGTMIAQVAKQSPPTYTITEVAKHNAVHDCFIAVNGKVYDITSYFGKHPAGDKIMLPHCGKETSRIFASIHSNFAWNLLTDYYIGDIVER